MDTAELKLVRIWRADGLSYADRGRLIFKRRRAGGTGGIRTERRSGYSDAEIDVTASLWQRILAWIKSLFAGVGE